MDSELVIGDRPNEPVLMNGTTWRARQGSMEGMTDGTWHCHGMDHKAKRTWIYVLQKFWQDYISDRRKTVAERIYRRMHWPYRDACL